MNNKVNREVTNEVTKLIGNLKAKNMNGEPEMKLREKKKKKTERMINKLQSKAKTNERKRINKLQSKAKEKEK